MAKSSSRRAKNAQPVQEPKPSSKPSSPSPSFSDSSMEDTSNISGIPPEASYGYSASRLGSPTQSGPLDTEDSVTCQWDDCGKVFTHLPTLIHHIHNGKFLVAEAEKRRPKTPRRAASLINVTCLLTRDLFFCYRPYWRPQIKLHM
jgi:hypothetical protein